MARIAEDQHHPAGGISNDDLRNVSESDWLSNLIATSKLVVTAGDLIAVPHVRWAASAVLFFLESIQVRFFSFHLYLRSLFISSNAANQTKQEPLPGIG